MAIVANAGTTNTGAIDPLGEIGKFSRERAVWFHVDGAYGLPGILDRRVSPLYKGLELADSVIVDPHKWLGASVGVAATFVRDRSILERAFTQEPADYLEGTIQQEGHDSPAIEHSMDDFGVRYYDYGVELSSPCRGIAVWAMLREIGVEGMRERIVRHNDMARYIAKTATEHPHLELVSEPVLSICCFRYVHPGIDDLDLFNQRLYRRMVRENQYMPSTTRIRGKLALRPCFIGARTEFDHARGLIDAVVRLGDALVAKDGADS
jgi:aromatic-L-amino-acid decarboxylase